MAFVVTLMGHNSSAASKKLKLTRRRISQMNERRFPNRIFDNWVVITSTAGEVFKEEASDLEVRIQGRLIDSAILDKVKEGNNKLHLYIAAFIDVTVTAAENEELVEPLDPNSVGGITVTIETETTTVEVEGDITATEP